MLTSILRRTLASNSHAASPHAAFVQVTELASAATRRGADRPVVAV